MNANTITADRIIEIARDMTEAGKLPSINADTPLTEIFDSFAIFEFILQLEEGFGVEIDMESIPEETPITAEAFAGIISPQLT